MGKMKKALKKLDIYLRKDFMKETDERAFLTLLGAIIFGVWYLIQNPEINSDTLFAASLLILCVIGVIYHYKKIKNKKKPQQKTRPD